MKQTILFLFIIINFLLGCINSEIRYDSYAIKEIKDDCTILLENNILKLSKALSLLILYKLIIMAQI